MLYKFQSDWNKNSEWLLTKKQDGNCVHEKELKIKSLYQNSTAMQNTEDEEKWCEKGKDKSKTTAKYIQFDAWPSTFTKRYNAKTSQG